MIRQDAQELLPIIKAFAEGKIIEVFDDDRWVEIFDPSFSLSPKYYRVKPEPKYRPFKTHEECWEEMHKHPDFGWIKNDKELVHICNISKTNNNVIVDFHSDIHYSINVVEVFYKYTFTDGALFGVKED